MSGTDHDKAQDWGGPQPVFVLVGPQMGENIGAAARAMWNFGLEHMRLVAPRDGWPNPAATAMASGAARVLDQVLVAERLSNALHDLNYVYATTARSRDLTKPVVTPEFAMADARRRIAEGQTVGVLFGPERAGLENEDIAQANAIVSVPVNPGFASLNLAQCVLLTAYEWGRQGADQPDATTELAGTPWATGAEVDALMETLEARLDASHFFWPEDKAPSMKLTLRNMLSRMPLTQADIRTWHGIIKFLADRHPKP
ncbi:MAG: RNA methyltransferase [Pseudomonadota bacterium]